VLYVQTPPAQSEEPPESEAESIGPSEEEVKEEIIKPLQHKSRSKPKPAYRNDKDAPSGNEDKQTKKAGLLKTNRKHGRDDSEAEEAGMSEKAKGKRKARDESDVEQPADKKSGRKATAEVETASAKPKSRGAARAESEISEPTSKKGKSTSHAEPKAPPPDNNDSVDDDSGPKKKKRKINIFPTAQPTSFPWGQLSQVGPFPLLIIGHSS
jgi:hypothetical protein